MSAFVWKRQYAIGLPSIDDQHRRWFGILNELDAAVSQGRSVEQTHEALDAVLDYTREHFAEEERLMKLAEYPGFQEHKAAHDRLVAVFESIRSQGEYPTRTAMVLAALRGWIEDHILGMDFAYAGSLDRYLKAQRQA